MPPEDDLVARAKTGVELVGEVMKAAGNDPQVKTAASELGKTAVTLTKAINVFLLPLAAINFAVDKARAYFESRFADELAEVAKEIPPEEIAEPKASLAGPLLQSLAFAHEEPDLKQMYLHLLVTGMDRRRQDSAHPSFVEIIKQLTSDEAQQLRTLLRNDDRFPIAEIRLRLSGGGWFDQLRFRFAVSFQVLETHLQNYVKTKNEEPVEIQNRAARVDNWVRLGLVEASYDVTTGDANAYDWVELRPEYLRLKEAHGRKRLWVVKGALARTQFGKQFAEAVGLSNRGIEK